MAGQHLAETHGLDFQLSWDW